MSEDVPVNSEKWNVCRHMSEDFPVGYRRFAGNQTEVALDRPARPAEETGG
jgi:hypothetical protein